MASGSTGQFFLAYGLNLSPEFMKEQLCQDSFHIGMLRDPNMLFPWTPLAIAYLEGYEWIISERGEANLVPVSRKDRQTVDDKPPPIPPSSSSSSSSASASASVSPLAASNMSGRRNGNDRSTQSSNASSLQESIISRMAVSSLTNVEPSDARGPADGRQESSATAGTGQSISVRTDVVYGILYYLPPSFERVMDTFQGFALGERSTTTSPSKPLGGPSRDQPLSPGRRKLIEKVHIYHCLVSPNDMNRLLKRSGSAAVARTAFPGSSTDNESTPNWSPASSSFPFADGQDQRIDAVVYIDDIYVGNNCDPKINPPPLKDDYSKELNKGVAAAVEYGLPKQWVNTVIRRWVSHSRVS